VSRARQAVESASPRLEAPEDVINQLDRITDRFKTVTKAVKGASKGKEAFDQAYGLFSSAVRELVRNIEPRGLRADLTLEHYDAILGWTKLPSCMEGEQTSVRPGDRDIPGAIATLGDSQSITSPFPEHKGEWVVSFRCLRCHDGSMIYAIGHHIYAESYTEKPWVLTAKTSIDAADYLDIARNMATDFLDQMPTYYERFNLAIAGDSEPR
jgi:hypothetical protein